jgi:calcyclin binding protein
MHNAPLAPSKKLPTKIHTEDFFFTVVNFFLLFIMVLIEDITETREKENKTSSPPSASQERMLDAEEIEGLVSQLKRPTARLQVETLVKKMRKEAAGLKALEATNDAPSTTATTTTATATIKMPASAPIVAPTPHLIPASSGTSTLTPTVTYTSIDKFAFDAGGYNEKFVTLYLPLPGVGSLPKDNIHCTFDKDKLDVTVIELNGKNYRLKKDNLEHDIVPDKSKYIIKADKVIIKLHKIKGEYGSYDYWSKLSDPKGRSKSSKSNKSDPTASITEMMKEMYESGDDNMRKIIGETMLKQRNGELGKGGLGGGHGDLGDSDDF